MLMLDMEAIKRQHVNADPCLAKSTAPGHGGRGPKCPRWLPLQRLFQAPVPAHPGAGQTPGACTRRSMCQPVRSFQWGKAGKMHQGKAAVMQPGQGCCDAAGAAACQAGKRRTTADRRSSCAVSAW